MKIAIAWVALALFAVPSWAADPVTPGTGLSAPTLTSTGVYEVANLHSQRHQARTYRTLALWHKGRMLEVHTRAAQNTYLRRGEQSTPVKVATSRFDQLIALAGINNDVERLSADKRQQFYQVAGLGSVPGQSMPPVTDPGPNRQCPRGYELKKTPQGMKCQVISWAPHGPVAGLMSWLGVPRAEAYVEFKFRLSDIGHLSFAYSADLAGTGVAGWRFRGFGFDVLFLDMPAGG